MPAPREVGIMSRKLWPEPLWRRHEGRLSQADPKRLQRVARGVAARAVDAAFPDDDPERGELQAALEGHGGARKRAKAIAGAHDKTAAGGDKTAFRKARAALCVWFATSDNPTEAARDGLYEARHAIPDQRVLHQLIEIQLSAP